MDGSSSSLPSSPIVHRGSMSGNPVRIGDGCATVKGYEFPHAGLVGLRLQPLVQSREGGSEVGCPKSGYRSDRARHGLGGSIVDCGSLKMGPGWFATARVQPSPPAGPLLRPREG